MTDTETRTFTKYTDAEIEEADRHIERAFSLLGLVSAKGDPICPDCGEDRRGKVKLIADQGRFKCYPGDHFGYTLGVMQGYGNHSFPDAVALLLGRKPSKRARAKVPTKVRKVRSEPAFTAEVDPELYTWIARQGDKQAAAEYFAQWHIDPRPVAEAGCFYLPLNRVELMRLQILAVDTFGRERLIKAGVAQPKDPDKVRPPRNDDEAKIHDLYFAGMPPGYPVAEPHVQPDGQISYMQFRPDGKTRQAVVAHKLSKREHKAWKAAKAAAEEAGEDFTVPEPTKSDYKPPFLSLRGAPHSAMIGGGVYRLARLQPGQVVVVVEGIKDLLAARTMGAEAYAIPGAKTLPPPEVCAILARHRVAVALDGDEAGDEAREQLIEYLREAGVTSIAPKQMPANQDVTDILVSNHAKQGCTCPACSDWLAVHG